MEQALARIHEEMDKNKDNEYVQCVGAYLADYLRSNPGAAAAILVEGKTIAGSLDAMRKVAEGKKKGNMAVLTPAEGYKAVLDYYDIRGAQPAAGQPMVQPPVSKPGFSVSLTDLLE